MNLFIAEAASAGYGEIVLPVFEEAGVFLRVGEATEIVQKQMYEFQDRDDRHMVLRPESTASVIRAFVQHSPVVPFKVWYEGPHFRYERPQAGRFRQFHQVGAEIIGVSDPMADVEIIAMGWRFFLACGVSVELLLNSLGNKDSRSKYIRALGTYLEDRQNRLSSESVKTLKLNPLRVLDSKREEDQNLIQDAPQMQDFISADDREHFESVRAGLELLGIKYQLSPRLVRGLDYYTRTAFEYVAKDISAAQDALGGGGRYDGLSQDMGGPSAPGVGLAIGLDRTLLALNSGNEPDVHVQAKTSVDVFVVDVTGGEAGLELTHLLRDAGISACRAFEGRSLKAQMKLADKSGARLALIVGEDEKAQDSVSLKELRASSYNVQTMVLRNQLVSEVKKRLTNKTD